MLFKKSVLGVALCTFFILVVSFLFFGETHYGLGVLSESEYQRIIETHTKSDEEFTEYVTFSHHDIFYDHGSSCYMITAVSQKQSFTPKNDVQLYWAPGDYSEMDASITQNKTFHLVMVHDDKYTVYPLRISTLPLIRVTLADGTVPQDRNPLPAEVTIITPADEETGRHGMQTFQCTINLRGQTAFNVPKKSYELDLKDKDGKPLDASLLGMRKDDDWALNGCFSESSKIREPVLSNVWKDMIAQQSEKSIYGFSMKNCEFFLNDSLLGIYQLVEPVDEKQERLDKKNDRLYKYWGWIYNSSDDFMYADDSGLDEVSGIKLVNRKYTGPENRWKPFVTYAKVFFDHPTDPEYGVSLSDAKTATSIENLIDCSIFWEVFQLMDNNPKNMFFIYRADEERPHMVREMWDLNYSMGINYHNSIEQRCIQDIGVGPFHWDSETALLLRGPDAAEFFKQYQERYNFLRKSVLSEETLKGYSTYFYEELKQSGAFYRENTIWTVPTIHFDEEYQKVISFIEGRLVQMDQVVAQTAKELGIQ